MSKKQSIARYEYEVRDVFTYLLDNPNEIVEKRGRELFSACIVAMKILQHEPSQNAMTLLWPGRYVNGGCPDLHSLVHDGRYTDEYNDTDYFLKFVETPETCSPYQTTTLVETEKGSNCTEKLRSLLLKKSTVQPDPKMTLVILADLDGECEHNEIKKELSRHNPPYRCVILLHCTCEWHSWKGIVLYAEDAALRDFPH